VLSLGIGCVRVRVRAMVRVTFSARARTFARAEFSARAGVRSMVWVRFTARAMDMVIFRFVHGLD
jgi:hypothetical protein